MSRYLVNEVFYSLQGEGARAGTAAAFIRFAKCNLCCNVAEQGFDCDTDFEQGEWYQPGELVDAIATYPTSWVILTGGEPSLQVDVDLVARLHKSGWKVAMETNGTRNVSHLGLDWVTVSPKTPWIHQRTADEVKYVLAAGAELPPMGFQAEHRLLSPAFGPCDHDGDCEPPACPGGVVDPEALAWCIKLVMENPGWRLSCQQHKWWNVR